jgi:hypothetical protein
MHASTSHLSAFAFAAALAASAATSAVAQSNIVPGTDVALGQLGDIDSVGRTGTFPNGLTGAAMSTTSCNFGSVEVPWFQVPNENHPFIAFLVTREDANGRIYQISDRSAVKHGFFALADNQCQLGCTFPVQFGEVLGVGCSDTYGILNNSDKYWLGPADEIDPWLGEWEMTCSYFDLGLTGSTCDGQRSFSQTQANSLGPVGTRINLFDQDLIDNTSTSLFAYQAYYVIEGEPEAARDDNMAWRRMSASFGGSSWNLNPTTNIAYGSILESWAGATVTSGTNANDDGRVHVGVKVTGPKQGLWHYEYALHNRDNARGVREIRIPICPSSNVVNIGFRDIDDNANNDWSVSVVGGEIVFTGTNNALDWNTIYNVWFDCDAAPETSNVVLVQDQPGVGAGSFTVSTSVPKRRIAYDMGAGCALSGVPPRIYIGGTQPLPSLGNSQFAITGVGVVPSSFCLLYGSATAASVPIPPSCTAYLGGLLGIDVLQYGQSVSDVTGRVSFPLAIPASPALEGAIVHLQAAVVVPGGPLGGIADLSNGLRLRVGSATTGCF